LFHNPYYLLAVVVPLQQYGFSIKKSIPPQKKGLLRFLTKRELMQVHKRSFGNYKEEGFPKIKKVRYHYEIELS
jgi:hypothetical protein